MIRHCKLALSLLSDKDKKLFFLLAIGVFCSTLMECVGISLIVPIISAVANPDFIQTNALAAKACLLLHIQTNAQFLRFSLLAILLLFILKNLYSLLMQRAQIRFSTRLRMDLKQEILTGFLSAPYSSYMEWSTPDLIQAVETDADGSIDLIRKLMQLIGELLMLGALCLLLLFTDYKITMIVLAFYGLLLVGLNRIYKPYMQQKSKDFVKVRHTFYTWIHQTVGNIKEIKAEKKEEYFIKSFAQNAQQTRVLDSKVDFMQSIPRAVLEISSVLCLLSVIGYFLLSEPNLDIMLSRISLFAFVAIRMMPSILKFNQLRNSLFWNTGMAQRTLSLLEKQKAEKAKREEIRELPFQNQLELINISFSYPQNPEPVLHNASMEIHAGEVVGISGASGNGKTTLIDLIAGLLPVHSGKILVDGVDLTQDDSALAAWQKGVAYLPQRISLINGSIRENLLFGSENRGDEALWDALSQADLSDFVHRLPRGLDTPVGESGAFLSGGQQQRLAFARALYKNARVLILDETTSALDEKAEEAIFTTIGRLKGKRTILIISHRPLAFQICDHVFTVEDGSIQRRS